VNGLEYMTGIVEGSHPKAPIQELVGFEIIEGRVVHRGRRVATAEGTVKRGSDGKLLAHGTSTCMILAADGPG
jgi:acyl-coenzyme A thioesterase PaaI-like protein